MATLLVLLMSLVVLAAGTPGTSQEGQWFLAFFVTLTVLLLGVMVWTGARAWRAAHRRRQGGESRE